LERLVIRSWSAWIVAWTLIPDLFDGGDDLLGLVRGNALLDLHYLTDRAAEGGLELLGDEVLERQARLARRVLSTSSTAVSLYSSSRGSISKIEFNARIEPDVTSDDEYKLTAVLDVLNTRLAKRGLPLKNFRPPEARDRPRRARSVSSEGPSRAFPRTRPRRSSPPSKGPVIKVQATIQADQLRITSRSKDALQEAMAALKAASFGVDMQFTNYR